MPDELRCVYCGQTLNVGDSAGWKRSAGGTSERFFPHGDRAALVQPNPDEAGFDWVVFSPDPENNDALHEGHTDWEAEALAAADAALGGPATKHDQGIVPAPTRGALEGKGEP
jgi:hypothetical protein